MAEGWSAGGSVEQAVETVDRRQGFGLGRGPTDGIRIQLLTDPWSVWCWGFEPVRRTLELRYPGIEFGVIVGGMFPEMPDPERRGFDVHRFFETVQAQTGMPVGTGAMEGDRPDSTYPACVHVHTVRLLDPDLETPYLRALREAVYLDGRNVSRAEVARDVAADVGVAPDEFDEMLEMGDARREFEQRIAMLQQMDLLAYPTLLFNHDDQTAAVQGFQTLANVVGVAEAVAERTFESEPAPDLDDAIPQDQRVATREVAQVLGTSVEATLDRLEAAESEDRLVRERHPGGDVWSRA